MRLIERAASSHFMEAGYQMLTSWGSMCWADLDSARLPRREARYEAQHRHGQIEWMADPFDNGTPCRCRNMREPRIAAHVEPRHRDERR